MLGNSLPRRNAQVWSAASECNRDAQEGGGNRCGIRARALILPVEEIFQLLLEIRGAAVLFGRFEGIHGGSVEFPELFHER